MGHFCALDSVCALVCVELRCDPATCVALPLASMELLVPSRRAPGGCQGCSSLSQKTASSCPMGVGVGATCTPALRSSSLEERSEAEMKAAGTAGWPVMGGTGVEAGAGELSGETSQAPSTDP